MSVSNPLLANLLTIPIDSSASAPPIAVGSQAGSNSGTGIYGSETSLSVAVSGTQRAAVSSSGLAVTGAITASTTITATQGITAAGLTSSSSLTISGAGSKIIMPSDFVIMSNAGVPDATTGANVAGKGSLCSDLTNGVLYINTGSKATPSWTVVGTQT